MGRALLLAAAVWLLAGTPPLRGQVPDPARDAPDRAQEVGEGEQELRIDSPYRWIERSRRVGGFGGRLSSARGDLQFGPGPAEVGGGRFRARVSSPLSLEVGLGGGLSERLVMDPLAEGGPRAVDSVPLRWAALDAGLQLALTGARTWNRLHPYVLLGAGLMFGVDQPISPLERAVDPPTEPGEENGNGTTQTDLSAFRYAINTAPTLHAGLGTELLASDRIGLALEARNLMFRLRTPPGYFREDVFNALEEAGAPAPRESQWTNNLHLTLSLWYYF